MGEGGERGEAPGAAAHSEETLPNSPWGRVRLARRGAGQEWRGAGQGSRGQLRVQTAAAPPAHLAFLQPFSEVLKPPAAAATTPPLPAPRATERLNLPSLGEGGAKVGD